VLGEDLEEAVGDELERLPLEVADDAAARAFTGRQQAKRAKTGGWA